MNFQKINPGYTSGKETVINTAPFLASTNHEIKRPKSLRCQPVRLVPASFQFSPVINIFGL
jgi:hypothetical protein